MDWKTYRPKALCIEATVPMSLTPNFDSWQHLLFEADYNFIKQDEVNHYYLDARF